MRMPRWRFTINQLMAAVAIVAILYFIYKSSLIIQAVLILWAPFGLLGERLTAGSTKRRQRPSPIQLTQNLTLMLVGAVVASVAGWVGLNTGVPTILSPLPLFSVVPAFYLSMCPPEWSVLIGACWSWLLAAVPFVTYLVLNFDFGFKVGSEPVPARFPILMAVATIASGYWIISGWGFGCSFQSVSYTKSVTLINILALLVIWVLWVAIRRSASRLATITLATLFHSWLYWFAFPWLGELP